MTTVKRGIALLCCLSLLVLPVSAVDILVEGTRIACDTEPVIVNSTTYVPVRAVAQALREDASVTWDGQAVVRTGDLTLTATPGNQYIEANGRAIYVPDGVRTLAGRVLIPVRALARALNAAVAWDSTAGTVLLERGSGAILDASQFYNADDLYWLSRIISAESQGEPLRGKIAVGNVVLNRVQSSDFPSDIYSVIFDERWGGQFEPVRNGAIYQTPTAESVLAARLCLEGINVAGSSLYFLAPALTSNHWIMQNRPYVMTIGAHWFYA